MNAPPVPLRRSAENTRSPRKPVAVFVCHGMGQQVHYETIEAVVNALLREQGCREEKQSLQAAAKLDANRVKKQPNMLAQMTQRLMARPPWARETSRAEFVELFGHGVMRGALTLGLDGDRRDVHIYEGYWAPLTEGKIGVWQVFGFLLDAARLGIWNCLRNGGFVRFMFEKKEIFTGLHLGGLALLAALTYVILLLLVGPVLLANAFTLTSVLALLFGGTCRAWISHPLITVGTWYVARIELFLLLLGVAVVILPKLYSWLQRKALILRMVGWLMRPLCFVLAIGSLLGAGVVAWFGLMSFARYAIQVTGTGPAALSPAIPFPALPGVHFFQGLLQPVPRAMAGWVGVPYVYLRLAVIWGLALVFGYFVRWFLIEFAGDVAIYTSGYKVSAFDQVRSAIRQTVLDAAAPIYSAKDGNAADAPWLYDHIIVVGHSLGSVIAYDTLNTLIADDLACSKGLKVVERTRYLLTFGSPLDKTAFVFSTHSTKTHDFREKAAEEIQPLILNYAYRPQEWVNIWSPMDIISGRLRYYDDMDKTAGGGRRVANMWDKEAWVPFAAHTEYWQDEMFAREIYEAVLNAP
jgi:hypothetical protein